MPNSRPRSYSFFTRSTVALTSVLCAACYTGVDEQVEPGECVDTDGILAEGNWDSQTEDWSDPGAPQLEQASNLCASVTSDPAAHGASVAHHCFTTAVHAIHLPTRELMVHHGQEDERLWRIGSSPESMTWHPVPFRAAYETPDGEGGWTSQTGRWADLFCSGHLQLADGSVLYAGGNSTGRPNAGGLHDTFRFDPLAASNASDSGGVCPFGWDLGDESGAWTNYSPQMQYDRWYPTLTALGDGRVLISGGTSREEGQSTSPGDAAILTRFLEVYDPTTSPPSISTLVNAEFPVSQGVPLYPFLFLLPNGDVFYAGSEEAGFAAQRHGRILVPDYNHPNYAGVPNASLWSWAAPTITSTIRGGSAVMYWPGRIMKSGGGPGSPPPTTTEIIDLTDWPTSAPAAFSLSAPMNHARHFHTLTMLPDGKVLATGGNQSGSGNAGNRGEHYRNPIEYSGGLLGCTAASPCAYEDLACASGCPSVCINRNSDVSVAADCSPVAQDLQCSHIQSVECPFGDPGADAGCDANLTGSTCFESGDSGYCARSCGGDGEPQEGENCGLINGCPLRSPLTTLTAARRTMRTTQCMRPRSGTRPATPGLYCLRSNTRECTTRPLCFYRTPV